MHRRYAEVFEPPENIENLVPHVRWKRFGRWSSFTGRGYGFRSEQDGDIRREIYFLPGAAPDSVIALIETGSGHFLMTLDIDHDGRTDLVFDGHEAVLGEGPSCAVDRAPDGRRAQWLFAPAGTDPRIRASFLLYRDGDFFLFLLDANGDGKGDLGRGRYVETKR
jgi:hypothetical protein